jgi:hypothetical protein
MFASPGVSGVGVGGVAAGGWPAGGVPNWPRSIRGRARIADRSLFTNFENGVAVRDRLATSLIVENLSARLA